MVNTGEQLILGAIRLGRLAIDSEAASSCTVRENDECVLISRDEHGEYLMPEVTEDFVLR